MRNFIFLAALFVCVFISCSKEEELKSEPFAFSVENLDGKWTVSQVNNSEISIPEWNEYNYIIFQVSDKTFASKGFMGNGSGVFDVSGTTLTNTGIPSSGLYDSKSVRYTVNALTGQEMELLIEGTKIKLRKEVINAN